MKQKLIWLHGNQTIRWDYTWLPWFKTESEKLGLQTVFETLPDSIIARQKYWFEWLEDQIGTDENTILVGHSSGALCAMKYAETHPLLGSVLIGAAHTDQDDDLEKQSGYFDTPWQWESIKKNQQFIIQFGSTDDPYIPTVEQDFVHRQLDTDYHRFTDRGHFFAQTTFPELVEAIHQKLVASNSPKNFL